MGIVWTIGFECDVFGYMYSYGSTRDSSRWYLRCRKNASSLKSWHVAMDLYDIILGNTTIVNLMQ